MVRADLFSFLVCSSVVIYGHLEVTVASADSTGQNFCVLVPPFGFYVFEGLIKPPELTELQQDINAVLERATDAQRNAINIMALVRVGLLIALTSTTTANRRLANTNHDKKAHNKAGRDVLVGSPHLRPKTGRLGPGRPREERRC